MNDALLVLLDFDGTLCPIRRRPGLARLTSAQRAGLARLAGLRVRLAVLSGRSLPDLKARVGIRGALYGGNFGLELAGPGWFFLHPEARARRAALAALAKAMVRRFERVRGVQVEDKGASLSLHYRNVPPWARREFEVALARLRREAPPGLDWRRDKRVWTVLPARSWDKGKAALFLWRLLGEPRILAVGDDRSDEAMFRAVRGRGLSVRVGRGASGARCRIKDVAHVHRLLESLADFVR